MTTLIYKFATDQKELKRIKEDMKKYQDEVKKHKSNPKKAMEIQKKMFALSGEQMRHSFSSMLWTFLPVILIFAWMNASIAYEPITPNTAFNITIHAENAQFTDSVPKIEVLGTESVKLEKEIVTVFTFKGTEGKYTLWFEKAGDKKSIEMIITDEQRYAGPLFDFKKSVLNKAVVSNKTVKPFGDDFSILGWHPGWLGTYIILTIGMSMGVRKLLNVY
jgi:uncharacterized membrane protein (DUF106 family)